MKKETVQVLSFLSGLTLAAVVIGVVLSKSPSLLSEIESQADSVLKTTRSLVNTYKGLATKSKTAVNMIKKDPEMLSANEESEALRHASATNSQWDILESNAPASSHSSL